MSRLVLGPMLRYVDATRATVWVETDAPCEVEVLGHSEPTFCVNGRHYAIVTVTGLEPDSTTPYGVAVDGERAWPVPGTAFPPPVIRTIGTDRRHLRISFGSCRVAVPHHTPWTRTKDEHDDGREADALFALAIRMRRQDPAEWP